MQISIGDLRKVVFRSIKGCGIDDTNALSITSNIIAAEYFGKTSHGLVSCVLFHKYRGLWRRPRRKPEMVFSKQSWFVDGHCNSGHLVMANAVEIGCRSLIESNNFFTILLCRKMQSTVGFAGHYARIAAEFDLSYVALHTCFGGMRYERTPEVELSTNPFVLGIPLQDEHCILDISSAEANWSGVFLKRLIHGDKRDDFSVSPMAGQKGMAISIAIETFVSSLTGTKYFDVLKDQDLGAVALLINGKASPFHRDIQTASDLPASLRLPGATEKKLSDLKAHDLMIEVDEQVLKNVETAMTA